MKLAVAGVGAVAVAGWVAGCASLKPKPLPPIVHTDTVVVTKEVAPPLPTGDSTEICLSTGMPAHVLISARGDTLIGDARVRIKDVRPLLTFAGAYAADEEWFARDTLRFDKRLYRKAGMVQRRICDELKEVGRFEGVPLFAEVTAMARVPMILVPVRPGLFQPYTVPLPPPRRR